MVVRRFSRTLLQQEDMTYLFLHAHIRQLGFQGMRSDLYRFEVLALQPPSRVPPAPAHPARQKPNPRRDTAPARSAPSQPANLDNVPCIQDRPTPSSQVPRRPFAVPACNGALLRPFSLPHNSYLH